MNSINPTYDTRQLYNPKTVVDANVAGRKKEIAIFGVKYFPSKGGTSRVVEALLQELHHQYNFTLYCYKHPKASQHLPNVKVVEFPETNIKGIGVFWFYIKCFLHLWRQKGKYDLVHIHKIEAALFMPLLSRRFDCIVTSHALPYLNNKWSKLGKLYFRIAESLFMNKRGTQTAISKDHKRYFEKKYKREIKYIPNGIDLTIKKDCAGVEAILQSHGVKGDYVFFAARRIIPLKGLHTLLEGLKKIQYTGSVVIAGDMDQMKGYTQEITELAEGLKVHFIGFVGQKPVLLGLIERASLFVFPSELEGMSIMLLEAASTGCPIICSDIPANKNMFEKEEVLFFRSKDVGDMAEKLTWAFLHPQEMTDAAEKARKKVYGEFSCQSMASEYSELYRSKI